MCGRTFIMKVPEINARLTMFSDYDSILNISLHDNFYRYNLQIYVRYICPVSQYDNGSYTCVTCTNPKCLICYDNTNNCCN